MKYHKIFLWGFWGFFLLCQTVDANSREEFALSQDAKQRDLYQGNKKFKCPSKFGSFPDPDDCHSYYTCLGDIAHKMTCGRMKKFDIRRRTCVIAFMAICEDDKDKTKSTASTRSIVTTPQTTTPNGDDFTCPSFFGSFPHPNDCSKYYSCSFFRPSLKSCLGKELFDAIKKECRENDVHCGNRRRPDGFTTTSEPNETSTRSKTTETAPETTTESITTETAPETTTESITTETAPETTTESTTTETTPATTAESITTETAPATTTESITTETTTESITTETATESMATETTAESLTTETTTESITTETTIRPTGPPEHNCTEDDLDCIITETGDLRDWFKCPQDVGFYPHQSSDKLFIFCMNWIPSVKKCGLDHVFSKERSTCV